MAVVLLKAIDTVDWICSICLFVGIFLYIPMTVYYLRRFKLYSTFKVTQIQFFKVRHPSLVYLINILCILIVLVERPFASCYYIYSFSKYELVLILPPSSFEFVHCTLWFALLIILCIKFYLLYFTQQLNLSLIDETWHKDINIGVTGMHI